MIFRNPREKQENMPKKFGSFSNNSDIMTDLCCPFPLRVMRRDLSSRKCERKSLKILKVAYVFDRKKNFSKFNVKSNQKFYYLKKKLLQ